MIKAIKKVKAEVAASNVPHVKVIGRFLVKHLRETPEDAKYILQEGKSIAGAVEAMAKEAMKTQQNGVGVLSNKEGFAIVLDYFKRKEEPKPVPTPKPTAKAKQTTKTKSKEKFIPLFDEEDFK